MSASQKWLFTVVVFFLMPVRVVAQPLGDILSNILLCLYLIHVQEPENDNSLGKYTILKWYSAFVVLYSVPILISWIGPSQNILGVFEEHSLPSILIPGAFFGNFEFLRAHADISVANRYLYMATLPAQAYSIIFMLFRTDLLSAINQLNRASRSTPYTLMILFIVVLNISIYLFVFSSNASGGVRSVSVLRLMLAGKEFELFIWSSIFMFMAPVLSILSIEAILVHYLAERKSDQEWRSKKENREQDR